MEPENKKRRTGNQESSPDDIWTQLPDRLSDIALLVGNKRIHSSRSILVHSPVFERMLLGDFIEKSAKEIELPGKNPEAVVNMVKYLHGEIARQDISKLEGLDAINLFRNADEYQLVELKDLCKIRAIKVLHELREADSISIEKTNDLICAAYAAGDDSILCETDKLLRRTTMIIKSAPYLHLPDGARLRMLKCITAAHVNFDSHRENQEPPTEEQTATDVDETPEDTTGFEDIWISPEQLSDMTLLVGDKRLRTSKAVLVQSPVFRKQLAETNIDEITVSGQDPQTFLKMMQYIHHKITRADIAKLGDLEAIQLYRVAVEYKLEDLVKQCRDCIVDVLKLRVEPRRNRNRPPPRPQTSKERSPTLIYAAYETGEELNDSTLLEAADTAVNNQVIDGLKYTVNAERFDQLSSQIRIRFLENIARKSGSAIYSLEDLIEDDYY